MTFSIVATDGPAWGVAVASKFLAVGAAVPAAAAGVGAIATQAHANLAYRPDGLALLRAGASATETLDRLVAGDAGAEHRQAGVVDAHGRAATYTGSACHPWAGGVAEEGVAIQGNILAGPQVVDAMLSSWRRSGGTPLARRLLAALAAGDEAGGDRRGRQSAALLVVEAGGGYGGGSDVLVDLRVDDHPAPVPELDRLLDLHNLYFALPDPGTLLPLEGSLATEVGTRLAALGHAAPDLATALADWAGIENFEARIVPGRIDPVVLDRLRSSTDLPT